MSVGSTPAVRKWESSSTAYSQSGLGQRAGELRLPDAFRHPGAGRREAELLHQIAGHAVQLFPPVGVGDEGQDRLVEAATFEFEASGGYERPQAG